LFDGTALQVSWGRAYKLPSFYALGNPIVGDPNLKPEDAETFEGGVTQALGGFGSWKVEAFATDYSNLIDFRPGAVPKLVNLSRVHVRGIETSLALNWGDITATPRLSYTNARNQATNAALRDVPSWLAGAQPAAGGGGARPDADGAGGALRAAPGVCAPANGDRAARPAEDPVLDRDASR
jgi:vitamin B12 transporter